MEMKGKAPMVQRFNNEAADMGGHLDSEQTELLVQTADRRDSMI
jgi:hypothetical protein